MSASRRNAVATPKVDIPSPEKLDERGMRRQTLYLPPEVHEHIRDICHARRISQQKFFREVFDAYFQRMAPLGWIWRRKVSLGSGSEAGHRSPGRVSLARNWTAHNTVMVVLGSGQPLGSAGYDVHGRRH